MYRGGDIQEKHIRPNILVPVVYQCEICGKPKATKNHQKCSKIKQQMFANEREKQRSY
jgi:hypothetical protein